MPKSTANLENERILYLPFECLHSIPEGINEVRVWRDSLLGCERVGKRMDLSGLAQDGILPEPRTLQEIRHHNIVPVVTAAYVQGDYPPPMKVIELVTPYFPQGSITDALLRGVRYSTTQAVAITQAALRGLREMHEVHRILHRDVKSGNILLADDHTIAKIADLGLAGRLDSHGRVSSVNNPTLYSPPELAQGALLTPASDVYPMSLVLLELLSGPLPYAAYTKTFILERLRKKQCPVRSTDKKLPIWTPRDLRRIIKRAGASMLSNRYTSAREMDEDLSKARVVDWSQTDEFRWESKCRINKASAVAVEATVRRRGGGYTMKTSVRRTISWRRDCEDVRVDNLDSSQARQVFDHATQIAFAR